MRRKSWALMRGGLGRGGHVGGSSLSNVSGAQPRQHVARELLEEARLVVARRVEDQLVEAELDVRRDALDDLVGVVGDDEAAARAVAVGVGEPLHLDRVLDAGLLLARQRERRPPAARLLGVRRGRGRRRP